MMTWAVELLKSEALLKIANLWMALFGKNDIDIDDKTCAKLCDDAKTWHERSLQLVAASAATL